MIREYEWSVKIALLKQKSVGWREEAKRLRSSGTYQGNYQAELLDTMADITDIFGSGMRVA